MALEELTAYGTVGDVDEEDLRQALGVLIDPQHRVEIRLLPSGRSFLFPGKDPEAIVRAVCNHASSPGIYYTLNALRDNLNATAKDKDVVRRRLFLIDIDPVRPASFEKYASSDSEKAAALIMAKDVARGLGQLGWPEPVWIDSGNGYHLLFLVDLPNDSTTRKLLKELLYALGDKYDLASAKIDRSVHNASRISKLPGTLAAMKKTAPGRPHRRCQVLSIPKPFVLVPVEQLRATLSFLTKEKTEEAEARRSATEKGPPQGLYLLTASSGRTEAAYVQAALRGEVERVAGAKSGDRNNVLNRAAFCIGTLHHLGHTNAEEVAEALFKAAQRSRLDQDDGGPEGVRRTIKSGFESGCACPREFPEGFGTAGEGNGQAKDGGKKTYALETTCLATLQMEPIKYLIPDVLPLGMPTLFVGDGGQGKSTIAAIIAADVSAGRCCLGLDYTPPEACEVLLIACEDGYESVVLPKLVVAGADLTKIHRVDGVRDDDGKLLPFSVAYLDALEATIRENPAIKLVVIDPASVYVGRAKVDDHRDSELRAALAPLSLMLAAYEVAAILIMNLNKCTTVKAIYRVSGGQGYVSTARASFAFVQADKDDEDGDDVRLMLPLKHNVKKSSGFKYRPAPVDDEDRQRILQDHCGHLDEERKQLLGQQLFQMEWLGTTTTDVNEHMAEQAKKERGPNKVEQCADWLATFLAGYAYPSDEILSAALKAGFTFDNVKNAKTRLKSTHDLHNSCAGFQGTWWSGLGPVAGWKHRPEPPPKQQGQPADCSEPSPQGERAQDTPSASPEETEKSSSSSTQDDSQSRETRETRESGERGVRQHDSTPDCREPDVPESLPVSGNSGGPPPLSPESHDSPESPESVSVTTPEEPQLVLAEDEGLI
jgi:hypothetical protein